MDRFIAIVIVAVLLTETGLAQKLPRVRNVRVPQREKTAVRVSWEQPPTHTYSSFMIRIIPPATIHPIESPDETSRTFSDLVPGQRYTVTIRGQLRDKRKSPPLNFQIWSEPEPPQQLELTPIREIKIGLNVMAEYGGDYSVAVVGMHVNWEPSNRTTVLSGYDVQIQPREGILVFPVVPSDEGLDNTQRIYTGLTPGQEYTISVRTKTGPPYDLVFSSAITMTRRIPPAIPYSVIPDVIGATHATIKTIAPIVGIHDDLEFVLSPSGGIVSAPAPDPFYSTNDVYTITNLVPDTTYNLDVYSLSDGLRSWEPYSVQFTTSPSARLGLQVSTFDSTSVTLSWEQPSLFDSEESIDYLIEFADIQDPDNRRTEVISVPPGTVINAAIRDLDPGVTYTFLVTAIVNGERTDVTGEVVQTTIPPLPIRESSESTPEGFLISFAPPLKGRCPLIKIHFSPSPDGTPVVPKYYNLNEEILLPGLSQNQLYTIHARCVSNNLEGPELITNFSQMTNEEFETRLPCLGNRDSSAIDPPRPPQAAGPPDACCDSRPYRRATQTCCGSSLLAINGTRLCCGIEPYNFNREECCGSTTVRPRSVGCDDLPFFP